jgi:ABC-type antimicrobial peptide transport system permease subunit
MAMGATSTQILSLILGEGGKLSFIGVVLGLLGAMGASPLVASLMPGMSGADPLAALGAAGLVTAVTAIAMVVPAWRASRVAPEAALRAN